MGDKSLKLSASDVVPALFLGLIPLGVGAYHGYCRAQGIPIENNLENILLFGPAVVAGSLGAAIGAAEDRTIGLATASCGAFCGILGGTLTGYGVIGGYVGGALVGYLTR